MRKVTLQIKNLNGRLLDITVVNDSPAYFAIERTVQLVQVLAIRFKVFIKHILNFPL